MGAADAGRARRRSRARLLPPARGGRCARAPPVRLVHDVGGAVRRAGGERPRGARDQADDLPDGGARERDRALADQGRGAGQAGRDPRRAQGALRRRGEHRTCPRARRSRRARRVRPRRSQDPRQGAARRPPGARRHPPVLPRRHRQLQPQDRAPLRGPRALLLRRRPRTRPDRPLQPPHGLQPPGRVPPPPRGTHAPPRGAGRTHPAPGRAGPVGSHRDEDEQPGRHRDDRRPLRRRRGRSADRSRGARHLLPAAGRRGPVGVDPGPFHRGRVPRALARLPVRPRPGGGRVPDRLGRPHASQPRPPCRSHRAGRRPAAARSPRGRARHQPHRRHARVGAGIRRHLVAPRRQHGERHATRAPRARGRPRRVA